MSEEGSSVSNACNESGNTRKSNRRVHADAQKGIAAIDRENIEKILRGSFQTTSLCVVPPQDRLRSSDESARQSQERHHALTIRDMSSICSKHAGTQLEASQNLRRKQGSKCHQQISARKLCVHAISSDATRALYRTRNICHMRHSGMTRHLPPTVRTRHKRTCCREPVLSTPSQNRPRSDATAQHLTKTAACSPTSAIRWTSAYSCPQITLASISNLGRRTAAEPATSADHEC